MKQEPPTASQGPLRGAPLLVTYLGGISSQERAAYGLSCK
jgi:hypothetical protein